MVGGLVNDRLDGQPSAATELYQPSTGSWVATAAMKAPRWGHTATLLSDGRVLVAGGYLGSDARSASVELYDPVKKAWSKTGDMTRGRGGHSATLLSDGRVLVVGGGLEDASGEGGPRSPSAELYDPRTGTWTATGSMRDARTGFTATLLSDGRVLVAGGDAGFTSVELYEPRTGRWTPTEDMAEGRMGHTATRLADGRVLVTGGCACSDPGQGELRSTELYDPIAGTWSGAGEMRSARIFHEAVLLHDGRVLVGTDDLWDRAPSAELYQPTSGRWIAAANPAEARTGYTATLLGSGKVLVAGDYARNLRSAELFDPDS